MTDKHPEALRLADALMFAGRFGTEDEAIAARRRIKRNHDAAAELRRQHALIAELVDALRLIAGTDPVDAALDPQRAVRIARAALSKAEAQQ
jgi:hypothetical protein